MSPHFKKANTGSFEFRFHLGRVYEAGVFNIQIVYLTNAYCYRPLCGDFYRAYPLYLNFGVLLDKWTD